jgi:hypothetical protein
MPRRDERSVRADGGGRRAASAGSEPNVYLSPPVPGLLSEDDRLRVATQFGVDDEQVVRDHAISHALAAIASLGTEHVVFLGGTALARTLLTDVRLSEDIDLIARGDRREIGDRIEDAVYRGFRSTLGEATFTPRIRDTRHPDPSVLQVGDTTIQVQLLSCEGYPAWPTEVLDVEQRYADAPPARLRVLTRPHSSHRSCRPGRAVKLPATCTTCGLSPRRDSSPPSRRSCSVGSARTRGRRAFGSRYQHLTL